MLRIVRKVADEYGADLEELEAQAWVYVAKAMQTFNGKGNQGGWISHCLRKQLPAWLARSHGKKSKVQSPLAFLDRGPTHFSTIGAEDDSEPDDDKTDTEPRQSPSAERVKLLREMPPFIVIRKECVAAVRAMLGNDEMEILRLKEDGMKADEIGRKIRMAARTVRERLLDIKKAIHRQAEESGISRNAIIAGVLHDDAVARERAIALLGA